MAGNLPGLAAGLEKLEEFGLSRNRRKIVSLPDGWCQIENRRLRNFASNDYLNLSHDPRLIEAATNALKAVGVGATASALVTGRSSYHEALEVILAEFEGAESAVLFPSGYAANVGTIAAIVRSSDVVFCDRWNHASLIDGCKLSGAKLQVYHHHKLDKLQSALERAFEFERKWIITDTIFSMEGDAAPLRELIDLANSAGANLIVDEAHATGLFGEHGRGLAESECVEDLVAVRIGTLSKAVGTMGGFVAGSAELCEWLWNMARSQMFSTSLPPAICAAANKAVELIQEEPWRRERVLSLARMLRLRLTDLDFHLPPNGVAPIVPVIFRDVETTMHIARTMEEAGLLVAAIRSPTVQWGTSRIRITLTAAHTEEDVDSLVQCLITAQKTIPNRETA